MRPAPILASESGAQSIQTVVLLHGLHDPQNGPFTDLLPIEQLLLKLGIAPIRSQWPERFNPLLALAHRRRSFASELAESLDSELRGPLLSAISGKQWALLGHSAGGLTIYRWLVTHAARFASDMHMEPELVVTLAAPYQCRAQAIRFKAVDYPIHEQPIEPADIVAVVPRRLVVFIGGRDEVLLPTGGTDDVTIPATVPLKDRVAQYLVEDATHSGICAHPETLELIAAHLRNP